MRCSKCQYISFDQSDRCRNCGYEFSLAAEDDPLDLPIRTGNEPSGPLSDFSLGGLDAFEPEPPAPPPGTVGPRRSSATREGPAHPSRAGESGELPLFRDRGRDDDAPLVSLPASPRAPVAVRRSTAAPRPAPRTVQREPELDLAMPDGEREEPGQEELTSPQTKPGRPMPAATGRPSLAAAPLPSRLLASIIDLGLLAAIDAVVLYFTLQLVGLGFADTLRIPLVPFSAFIALLNGGYITAFTAAGGQTIGKMMTGLRVVTSDDDGPGEPVTVGTAALRALGYGLSALPAGLGFLTVLLGADRRGLHDRLAHTRVVKA